MTTRRIGRAVQRAADLWAEWHQKEPTEMTETSYPLERYPAKYVGRADTALYFSDKWEDDFFEYLHEFSSGPSVFMPDGDGYEESAAKLLSIPRVAADAEAALPILAGMMELIIKRDDGSKVSLRFDGNLPMLCGCLDKKGLVILSSEGPIYVRGGRMRWDERGVHH